jgi:hypothetical protein
MNTQFFPSFNDTDLRTLEICAEQVKAKVPEELAEFDALRETIKAVAEKTLAEGSTADISAIMAVIKAFKPIYLKANDQKKAYEGRLQEQRSALKSLLEEL